jgi:hypothetical protein
MIALSMLLIALAGLLVCLCKPGAGCLCSINVATNSEVVATTQGDGFMVLSIARRTLEKRLSGPMS